MALPALPKVGAPITAADVSAIEQRVTKIVKAITNIDQLKEFLAQAAALEAYLRGRDLQRPMLGAQRRIEGRIGQLFGEARRGRPAKNLGNQNPKHAKDFNDLQIHEFRILGRALSGDCEVGNEEWQKSRAALVALVRFRLGLMPETPPFPDGQFHCIVADPPWELDTGPNIIGGTGEAGHDALSYAQLDVEAIAKLPVEALAAADAHLYLWTTNRYLEISYDVARAWGFEPSAMLVWCKAPRGIGLGDTFRQTAEFVLFARRGHLTARRIVDRTWFEWPRGRHSVKPDAFYELVESVSPPPYLDLFARRTRANWTIWGAEAPQDEVANVASGE